LDTEDIGNIKGGLTMERFGKNHDQRKEIKSQLQSNTTLQI
jgi:hypothetical protein